MKVELKKLELTNYRNIPHAIYEFDGNSKIVGENRIGKTNTLEAIVWLLTDKLLNGSSDIQSIKPLEDTKLEVRVKGTFLVDGKEITIEKEYGEDWVKTRGGTDLVMKGHYLNYIYNGTKQKTKRDFYTLFNEDFGIKGDYKGIELARLLIDPFYVGDLGEGDSWKDLRAFIISLIGDINESEIYAKDPTLTSIKSDLDVRMGRIDELKKFYQGEIDSLKEQLIGDDAQIKLLESTTMPSEDELAVAKKAAQEIDEDIAKLQSEKASESAIIDIDKQMVELGAKQNQIAKDSMNNEGTKELETKLTSIQNEYHTLLEKKARLGEEKRVAEFKIPSIKREIEECLTKRQDFINKLRECDAKLGDPFTAECPTCHRPLEGADLEKAKTDFFNSIQKTKEGILFEGKRNKERKEYLEEELNSLELGLDMTEEAIKDNQNAIGICSLDMKNIGDELKKVREEPTTLPEEYYELGRKIEELAKERIKIQSSNNAINAMIREKVEEKLTKKATFQKVIDDYNYALRQKDNLVTIKQTKVDHAKDLARFEQKKELLNRYIKVKLELLDERVARVFGDIKFQLIKENINGGYDPVCKPYIYDVLKGASTNVTWRNGSKSERVVTGIAIAERIKAALGLANLPFLFDEGGEISTDTFSTRFKTDSQLICVKVTDNIKTPMVMKI